MALQETPPKPSGSTVTDDKDREPEISIPVISATRRRRSLPNLDSSVSGIEEEEHVASSWPPRSQRYALLESDEGVASCGEEGRNDGGGNQKTAGLAPTSHDFIPDVLERQTADAVLRDDDAGDPWRYYSTNAASLSEPGSSKPPLVQPQELSGITGGVVFESSLAYHKNDQSGSETSNREDSIIGSHEASLLSRLLRGEFEEGRRKEETASSAASDLPLDPSDLQSSVLILADSAPMVQQEQWILSNWSPADFEPRPFAPGVDHDDKRQKTTEDTIEEADGNDYECRPS